MIGGQHMTVAQISAAATQIFDGGRRSTRTPSRGADVCECKRGTCVLTTNSLICAGADTSVRTVTTYASELLRSTVVHGLYTSSSSINQCMLAGKLWLDRC
jgi:hypothetical protein